MFVLFSMLERVSDQAKNLCEEAVFAAIGGWIVLGETLTARGLLGCTLMLTGMLLSQLWGLVRLGPAAAGGKNA